MNIQRKLKIEEFKPNINTNFKLIDANGTSIDLKLFKIEEKHSEEIDSFTLLFEASSESVAYDNTYKFYHESIGEFLMFISPYAQNNNKILYESIFSRLKNEEVI